jgi:hypothetical protein
MERSAWIILRRVSFVWRKYQEKNWGIIDGQCARCILRNANTAMDNSYEKISISTWKSAIGKSWSNVNVDSKGIRLIFKSILIMNALKKLLSIVPICASKRSREKILN